MPQAFDDHGKFDANTTKYKNAVYIRVKATFVKITWGEHLFLIESFTQL